MLTLAFRTLLLVMILAVPAWSNPYLPKPGDRQAAVRVATSAVTGGFVHLYAGLDYRPAYVWRRLVRLG